MILLINMTLNKVVLPPGESVYHDTKGEPMLPYRSPTEFHYLDRCLEQADATDFVCVSHVIAQPWQQCFVLSADIGKSEDLLSDEELHLVQGYVDRLFHD